MVVSALLPLSVKLHKGESTCSLMAQFYECWSHRRSALDELQALIEDANEHKDAERRAATDIQRLFRGQRVRATVTTQTNAEIVVARVYRGHLARRRCQQLRKRRTWMEQRAVFEYHVILLQKMLRGMHSRRTKLDFNKRKAYIREITQRGDEMRRLLEENLLRQKQEETQANEQAARQELAEVSRNLHHLVSTHAIAGVYNSPMLASEVTAFGVPVETHIKDNTKSLISTQLAAAKSPTRLIPYPPSNKQSLQATPSYDTPLRAVRTHKKYQKLRRISAEDFRTVHNSNQDTLKKISAPGINDGVNYMDDWENPYKIRGVPRKKEDLLPRLTTLGKPPKEKDKPFYLTSGGNKSKVYANDRFDV